MRRWIQQEVEFLKDNYHKMDYSKLGVLMNRNRRSIQDKVRELNLRKIKEPPIQRKWTQEEIKFLQKNYTKFSSFALAKKLNRTSSSILHRLKTMKLKKGNVYFEDSREKMRKTRLLKIARGDKDVYLFLSGEKSITKNKDIRKKMSIGIKEAWKRGGYSEAMKIRKGKHFSPGTQFKKGNKPHNLGKSKENYLPLKIVSKKKKEIRKCQKNTWTSSIELKLQDFLTQLNLEFFAHRYIKEIENGYQCDIFVPVQPKINKKIVIEADGDYWHNYPFGNDIDLIRTIQLHLKDFRIIRLWEHEIRNMNLEEFKEIIYSPVLPTSFLTKRQENLKKSL